MLILKIAGRLRFFAASAAFIALTAVKLLSPALASEICGGAVAAVSRNDDYMQAVETLGRSLDIAGTHSGAVPAAYIYRPATIGDLREKSTSILPSPAPSAAQTTTSAPAPTPTPAPTPAPKPTPSPVPKKVQAFLNSQKAYAGYEVPSDVSYDVPTLPFKYAAPVKGVTSSGFGFRMHPILNKVKFHYGTDYAAASGEPVYAFADGAVLIADDSDTFGKYAVVSHSDGYRTLYAHCSKLLVKSGDKVKKGQKIALVGATGEATGPHLHFELMCSGTYLNPEFYV